MILDTCFIIDLLRNDAGAVKKLNELSKKFEPIMVATPTIFELTSGLARSSKPEKEKQNIRRILKGQTIISFDRKAADLAGEIDGALVKEGKTIGPIDSMIAGIALSKKTKVLTRNKKDFGNIEGLELEGY